MSPFNLIKTLVIVVVLGYLAIAESEARTLGQEVVSALESIQNDPNALPLLVENSRSSNNDQNDSDDDDDDDDRANLQLQNPLAAQGSNLYYDKPIMTEQSHPKYQTLPSADLKTSASHHHHGHGAKGWLDMGAWTGKKGAFGWYDKHPVGKGK